MILEEFNKLQEKALVGIHPTLASVLRYKAYEQGHSAGYEEVLNILRNLISDFHEVNMKLIAHVPADILPPNTKSDKKEEIRNVLRKHNWKYLGCNGKDEGWEIPDAAVCSFTASGDWDIVQQWTGPKHCVLAKGSGADKLHLSLRELKLCDCCRNGIIHSYSCGHVITIEDQLGFGVVREKHNHPCPNCGGHV